MQGSGGKQQHFPKNESSKISEEKKSKLEACGTLLSFPAVRTAILKRDFRDSAGASLISRADRDEKLDSRAERQGTESSERKDRLTGTERRIGKQRAFASGDAGKMGRRLQSETLPRTFVYLSRLINAKLPEPSTNDAATQLVSLLAGQWPVL